MAASTAPGVIYAGPNYNTIDRSLPLFVHELGHLPQWASGRLTAAQYFMESIAVGLLVIHGQIPISDQGIIATIHDQIDVEQDATAFSASFLAKYGKGGPCG
jgi:hypothetical protein